MNRQELVYSVTGQTATPATPITLESAGFYERSHLQEWVLAHPEILGDDVIVITSEFDRWAGSSGPQADRLDILGLDANGRLVVAELKRDKAPDFVALQVIKYAAMASHFTVDQLADAYLDFTSKSGCEDEAKTVDEARTYLETRVPSLSDETLKNPRLVIIAGDFGPAVTSSVAWLTDQGLDITLTRVQAYQLGDAHVVTVSQLWPLAQTDDFIVTPTKASATSKKASPSAPEVPWSTDDLKRLATSGVSPTILTTMDLCSSRPGQWVGGDEILARTGRNPNAHRGDYGGFGITIRRKYDRSNPPFEINYAVGDTWQQYYRVPVETASVWQQLRPEAVAHAAQAPSSDATAAGSDDGDS